ncbi:MAG: hypothetical protein WAN61_00135 [Minisyncoccia bacterium]
MKTKLYKSITIISDCHDDNAKGRVMTRIASLLPGFNINFIGVQNDIEAAICLVDTLDALEDRAGTILVNIAPRNGEAKKWTNGTPFGEFSVGNIQIFSTIDGYILSFIQQFLKKKIKVRVYDIPKIIAEFGITTETQKRIINSQFRSFDFLTRLAAERIHGKKFTHSLLKIENINNDWAVGYIDRFGNIKTTKIYSGGYKPNIFLGKLRIGNKLFPKIKFYSRLKDVPDDELAIIVGSSGLGEKRLLEIVLQGDSAEKLLGYPKIRTSVGIV